MIEFYVQGIPKGQPRPRAFARRMGAKFVARVYDAGTAECWKSEIAVAARQHLTEPLQGPLRVELTFYFPRPKSHFTKKGLRPEAPQWHTCKPDADNAAKAVLDCLTTLGMWGDDVQVCELVCRKQYAKSRGPGALVNIQTWSINS